ncbi:hypothetical protein [Haliscomenobacter sp.]|uniref:hypothetical protein n=1 Tax=Haliscomenobacter sp. TaxID=2717303 RepID=UPI003BACCE77
MKQHLLCIYLLCLSWTVLSAQNKFPKAFKMLVLKPDTAILEKSLYPETDSIVMGYKQRYYQQLRQMDELMNFQDFPKELKKSMEKEKTALIKAVEVMKSKEPEIKQFKYFHAISAYSSEFYNTYYNEYKPIAEVLEWPNQSTKLSDLASLAIAQNADYVLFFENIHTEIREEWPLLKLKTTIYSKKESKIIFSEETIGDHLSEGGQWTCDAILHCLFVNGVKTSTELVFPF